MLVFIYGFPSFNGFFQVEFSSSAYLDFFVGSVIVSSFSCLMNGLYMFGLKTETKKVTEEKEGSIYDLNVLIEDTIVNTINRKDDSATEFEKTGKNH